MIQYYMILYSIISSHEDAICARLRESLRLAEEFYYICAIKLNFLVLLFFVCSCFTMLLFILYWEPAPGGGALLGRAPPDPNPRMNVYLYTYIYIYT